MNEINKNEKREVDRIEVSECLMELEYVNDNLNCVRWGLASGDCANPKVIDNALFLLNCRLDELITRLNKAIDRERK